MEGKNCMRLEFIRKHRFSKPGNIGNRLVSYWLMNNDPNENKKAQKTVKQVQFANGFDVVARE